MISRDFYKQFFNLKFWRLDAGAAADYLENVIRSENPIPENPTKEAISHDLIPLVGTIFDADVAAAVRLSGPRGGFYNIKTTESDVIKFIKSFINFVRAVKGIHPDVVMPFINHLLSPPARANITDTNLRNTVRQAYNHGSEFKVLYTHFLAFKFYMVGAVDLVWQLPILSEHSPVTATFNTIVEGFQNGYEQSISKKGVDAILAAKKKREDHHQNTLKSENRPSLDTNHWLSILNGFGLRTHLDALTEMAEIHNASHQKYYDKYYDAYYYPPTAPESDRQLMSAYNTCSGAKKNMIEAKALLLKVMQVASDKPGILKWEKLTIEERANYIQLNDKMQALNAHLSTLTTIAEQVPALATILNSDRKRINQHIADLKKWDRTTACQSINMLSGAINVEDAFTWISSHVSRKLTAADKATYYDFKDGLYRVTHTVPGDKRNVMLTYNINTRLKNGYAVIQKFVKEGFSIRDLGAAKHLLYEIGFMIKEYRQIDNPDFIKQVKEQLEIDLDLLLKEFARIFHQAIAAAQKLEVEQGLKKGLLIGLLEHVYGAYLYLLTLNYELPTEHQIKLDNFILNKNYLEEIKRQATVTADVKVRNRAQQAINSKQFLRYYKPRLAAGQYELIDLLHMIAELKMLEDYRPSEYAEHLQSVIDQMVGLDQLEKIIMEEEKAIKLILKDDIEHLEKHTEDPQVKKHLDNLRELYLLQAELRDMLVELDQNKDSSSALANIEIKHFNVRGYTERATNHLWTYFRYEPVSLYRLSDGVRTDLNLKLIGNELRTHQDAVIYDLDMLISTHPEVTAQSSFDRKQQAASDEIPASETLSHVAKTEALNDSNVEMLKFVINSRKGFLILKLEHLRGLLLDFTRQYIHENQKDDLKKKHTENGVLVINKKDSISVVNIKAMHNTVVSVERLFEVINKLAEIPGYAKTETILNAPKINAAVSELTLKTNALFKELELLTESMTALGNCLQNNTFNIFGKDLFLKVGQMLEVTQEVLNMYYSDKRLSGQKSNDAEPNALQTLLAKAIAQVRKLSPESKINEVLKDGDNPELKTDVVDFLENFLESSHHIPKTAEGFYDVKGLEENSVAWRVAQLMNTQRTIAIKAAAAAPVEATAPAVPEVSTKSIVNQVMKNAGDVVKHLAAANQISKRMREDKIAKHREAANQPDEKSTQQPNQLTIFLRLYVEQASKIRRHRDGSYDIRTLQDGTLQKCIAAFLNVESDLYAFMDSTVEMAEGHHITGFIKAINDLIDIKYNIDHSNLTKIFNDAFLQASFDSQQLSIKINALIVQALNYLQPKIVDTVAQARIAEVTLGLQDGTLVHHLESTLDKFIEYGRTFAEGKFDDIKKDFPYHIKTLQLAHQEQQRLKKLALFSKTKHNFLQNGVNSLKPFINSLKKEIKDVMKLPLPVLVKDVAAAAPAPAATSVIVEPDTVTTNPNDTILDFPPADFEDKVDKDDIFTIIPSTPEEIAALEKFRFQVLPDETPDEALIREKELAAQCKLAIAALRDKARQLEDTKFEALQAEKRAQQAALEAQRTAEEEAINQAARNAVLEKAIQAARENDASAKVKKLREACLTYKQHLSLEIIRLRTEEQPGRPFDHVPLEKRHLPVGEASPLLQLTIDKYNAIDDLQQTLTTADNSSTEKLAAFHTALTSERENAPSHQKLLSQRRDTAFITFWKVIATIFTFGIAYACGLWTPRGEKMTKEALKLAPRPAG